jgi:hypothetical protein
MQQMSYLYPATAAKAAAVRGNLALCGVAGARVRRMPNGSLRIVVASKDQRQSVRDALVMSDACTGGGTPFTSPDSNSAWNGDFEIFVRFVSE